MRWVFCSVLGYGKVGLSGAEPTMCEINNWSCYVRSMRGLTRR